MKLGETYNAEALPFGRPLDGVRVLALEQYIALPFATHILKRFGADVVKVESMTTGDAGRTGHPFVTDASGRKAGASILRYNLGKRSIAIDFRNPKGRELIHSLVPHFDIACENLGPGRAEKLGYGYKTFDGINPKIIYVSVTGFGNTGESPYMQWPAYAGIAEAMAGVQTGRPGQQPITSFYGPLGDTATSVFTAIGMLAALRHRDRTGKGQYIDVAMADAMLAMCDFVPNFWSLGLERSPDGRLPGFIEACRAKDGWFAIYVLRRHQFERLAQIVGRDEWIADNALKTPMQWSARAEDTISPAVAHWASAMSKQEAARLLAEAGIPAAPCNEPADLANDPHYAARRMLIEVPRVDGVEEPYLVAGNPIKMSGMAEGPEEDVPLVGEHTDEVLRETLGLNDAELSKLRENGVIA